MDAYARARAQLSRFTDREKHLGSSANTPFENGLAGALEGILEARAIAIDLETGDWLTETTLHKGEGARVAASVLPGMPVEEVERAYSVYMATDNAAVEPELVRVFKSAWHQADADGKVGERVSSGLAAVLVTIRRHVEDMMDSLDEHVTNEDVGDQLKELHNLLTGTIR